MPITSISAEQISDDFFTDPFHHIIPIHLKKTPGTQTQFYKGSDSFAAFHPEMGFSFQAKEGADLKPWAKLLYEKRIPLIAGEYHSHFKLLQTIGDIVPEDSPVEVLCRYEVQDYCIHKGTLPNSPLTPHSLIEATMKEYDKLFFFYKQSQDMHRSRAELKRTLTQDKLIYIKKLGKIVSAALTHCETPQAGLIGGVYTPKIHRKKGYSKACMLELMRRLKEEDKIPCLFYEQNNTPAKKLYEKLGYKPYGTWVIIELIFEEKTP